MAPDENEDKGVLHSVNKHLGSRIRLRRKQLGLSQKDLGGKLGMTFQQVQKYENGSNRIAAALLNKMGETLGVTIEYFFEGMPDSSNTVGRAAGFAESQHPLHPGTNSQPDQAETSALVRAYSRIPDPVVRERIVALLKVLQPEAD